MKQGKNHVSWNDNPPETAAQVMAEAREKSVSDSEGIGSPPRITKTTAVTSSAEFEEMKKKLESLKEEERQVDRYLACLKEQAEVFKGQRPPSRDHMACLPPGVRNIPDNMHVSFKDITAMSAYKSETVIGIRAPSGTSLEVPDPDQGMKPGTRRYEMYLSSKGAPESEGKGEPINVYLVQPQADQQNRGSRERPGGFIQETPTSQRTRPPPTEEHAKSSEESRGEQPRQQRPHYGAPPPRTGEPPYDYEMPPPNRGGEWGYGPGKSSYPPQDRGDASSPPGHPSRVGPYPEPSWGAHSYGGYPPPGYYPPPPSHRHSRPVSQHSPESQKRPRGRQEPRPSERARNEGPQSSSRHFSPPHHDGLPNREQVVHRRSDRGPSPFRSRPHDFHPSHEVGRTASSGGEAPPPRGAPGAFRPPSPSSQQQNLLNMPLQSPNDPLFANAFSPPGGSREQVRSAPVEFPIPPLPRNGRDYRDQWRPPQQKMGSSSQGEAPRTVAPRSHH